MRAHTSITLASLKHRFGLILPEVLVTAYLVLTLQVYLVISIDSLFRVWITLLGLRCIVAIVEAFETLTSFTYAAAGPFSAYAGNRDEGPHGHSGEPCVAMMHILVVAYLPNEMHVIFDRLLHATSSLIYPRSRLQIHVVYNTEVPLPDTEKRLFDLAALNPHLVIHRAAGSGSKAENVNFYLDNVAGADIVAIYDTDHYIHPLAPKIASERLMTDVSLDVVQGRCIVGNPLSSLLASIVAVEFDKLYAVVHLGRHRFWGTAIFTGSNAYWRAKSIQKIRFDPRMMAEDMKRLFEQSQMASDSSMILSWSRMNLPQLPGVLFGINV